jgi:hypothetical protein
MDRTEYQNLDINALKGKQWQVVVGTRQKMNGEIGNIIETVKPFKQSAPKPLKKAAVVTDDIADPFDE